MNKWISVGSKVIVYFEYVDSIKGTLIDIGETNVYLIEDEKGRIYQVMNYCSMETEGSNK